jgi:hypothetical protein
MNTIDSVDDIIEELGKISVSENANKLDDIIEELGQISVSENTCKEIISSKKTSGSKKCSICRQTGHNKSKCSISSVVILPSTKSDEPKLSLQTEDTGKQFEMAICIALGIEYKGKYKYDMKMAEELKPRLVKLTKIFPKCSHTAEKSSQYDFTSLDNTTHLSAKSTKSSKSGGKVAPQVIGQVQANKFCDIIGIKYTTDIELKKHIQTNIIDILPFFVKYTFDCNIIYYNQEENTIRYITMVKPVEWNKYKFRWTCNWDKWNNSSTLKVIFEKKEFALLECQFHSKNRTNMTTRWCFENFISIFKENLKIIDI